MTALSIQPPFPTFSEADGSPLEDGYIWIGTANLNPITNPIAVFWDAALTLPAAQPIRTQGGYPVNAGTPARLYVNSDYSIQVQNRNGSVVYSAPAATERLSNVVVTGVNSSEVTFLQSGLGAVSRTAQAKLRETVSVEDFGAIGDGATDDTTAIQAAITEAISRGCDLYFPDGQYVVGTSLSNLHSVRKFGPGAIKAGAATFYVDPSSTNANTIYVATSGNNSNDGLNSSRPLATLAAAMTVLASYGPDLAGTWTISLAAGTYSQGNVNFPVTLGNRNRVIIKGPTVNHPNVPTAIMDGGSSLAYGINFDSRSVAEVSNIKFTNYTTFGVVSQDFADILCTNVHASGITGGSAIKSQQGRLRVFGGIIQSCQVGVICISGTTFTIGDPNLASLANGTQILNCTQGGILAQENSTGHADYCTITNCAVGLEIVVSSRVHAVSCLITNNATAGVRARSASDWLDNGNTFSGNTANELVYSYSDQVGRDGSRTSALRQDIDLVFVTTTGVVTNQIVKTYPNAIYKDSFNSQVKACRVVVYGTITGTSGLKNITVNAGGSAAFGFGITATDVGDFVLDGTLYAFGTSGTQQSFWATLIISGRNPQVQQGSRSINMMTGAAIPVTVQETISGAGDTISIRGVEIFNYGGC